MCEEDDCDEDVSTLEKVVDNDWKMYTWFWGGLFAFLTMTVVSCQVRNHLEFKAAAEAGLEQQFTFTGGNIWVKPK